MFISIKTESCLNSTEAPSLSSGRMPWCNLEVSPFLLIVNITENKKIQWGLFGKSKRQPHCPAREEDINSKLLG